VKQFIITLKEAKVFNQSTFKIPTMNLVSEPHGISFTVEEDGKMSKFSIPWNQIISIEERIKE